MAAGGCDLAAAACWGGDARREAGVVRRPDRSKCAIVSGSRSDALATQCTHRGDMRGAPDMHGVPGVPRAGVWVLASAANSMSDVRGAFGAQPGRPARGPMALHGSGRLVQDRRGQG